MTIFDLMKGAILAGYGVQEKVKEFIDDLVKKGELSESQGAKMAKEWTEKADKAAEEMTKGISETFSKSMDKFSFAGKEELESLKKEVQELSERVRKLEGGSAEPLPEE